MLLRSLVIALLALAFAVPFARADGFVPVARPASGDITAFAASGSVWLVAILDDERNNTLWRTENGGRLWQPVELPASDNVRISVGPHGAFYVAAGPRLMRYAPGGGPGQDVPYGLSSQDGQLAAPAWDGQGRMWVELIDRDAEGNTTLRAARVEDGAAVDEASVADADEGASPSGLDPTGPVVLVSDGASTFRKDAASLAKVGTGLRLPLVRAGGLTFFSGGVSEDGGATVSTEGVFPALRPVAGRGGPFFGPLVGGFFRRWSRWLARGAGGGG